MYPALAVVEELRAAGTSHIPLERAGAEGLAGLEAVLYVGTAGGLEADIAAKAGVPFRAIRAAGLHGFSLARKLANGFEMLTGTVQSRRILGLFQPDVVLATGGYASAPVVMAAWLLSCPVLIYLPDIVPGLAVRFLSRFARCVAVSFDSTVKYFPPGKALTTGYPARPVLYKVQKGEARQRLGLSPKEKTLLVFGGSRGAHSINVAVHEGLEDLLDLAQVIHITGEADADWLRKRQEGLPTDYARRYRCHVYLHEEMADALGAADLAVARAGAATMGEFAAVGLPSILVPYPHAGRHQEANADFMVACGAARKLSDDELAHAALPVSVAQLLGDEATLRCMSESAKRLARPDAARAIAQQLARLSGG